MFRPKLSITLEVSGNILCIFMYRESDHPYTWLVWTGAPKIYQKIHFFTRFSSQFGNKSVDCQSDNFHP